MNTFQTSSQSNFTQKQYKIEAEFCIEYAPTRNVHLMALESCGSDTSVPWPKGNISVFAAMGFWREKGGQAEQICVRLYGYHFGALSLLRFSANCNFQGVGKLSITRLAFTTTPPTQERKYLSNSKNFRNIKEKRERDENIFARAGNIQLGILQ